MNIEQIAKRISNPNLCTSDDIDALRDLTVKYPYAQSFSILYLKALSSNNDIRFDEELLKHAYKITDKARIYELIQNKNSAHNSPKEEVETISNIEENKKETVSEEKVVNQENTASVQEDSPSENSEKDSTLKETKVETNTVQSVEKENDSTEIPSMELNKEGNSTEDQEEEESPSIEEKTVEEKELEETSTPSKEVKEDEQIDSTEAINTTEEEEETLKENTVSETIDTNGSSDPKESVDVIDKSIEVDPLEKEVILHAVSSNYVLEDQTVNEENTNELESEEIEIDLKELDNENEVNQQVNDVNLHQEGENINKNSSKKIAFSSWLKANQSSIEEKNENSNVKEENKKTEDIVNTFLTNQPTISKPVKNEEYVEKPKKEFYSPIKIGKKSLDESTLPVSETLAKIFAAQGNFPKSIYVYNKLMLIYPEKKIFFAGVIEELEQKLNK